MEVSNKMKEILAAALISEKMVKQTAKPLSQGIKMPKKKWAKRQARNKMQKQSRKQNRK